MIDRRTFLTGASIGAGVVRGRPALAAGGAAALPVALAAIEAARGGRLGVAVLDSGTGAQAGHRADERFPICSTFKLLAAAGILARVDAGQERLERRIVVTPADIVPHAPVTERRIGGDGMSLAELCEATMITSDNTAGNLLLRVLGGPPGLTAYVRGLGDTITRLDRWETALNEATPGDPRDTTSPAAMLHNMRALLLGSALTEASRARLLAWLRANRTGDNRLRAGLPAGWQAGDRTGTGDNGTSNDVGILFPPGNRPPILVAAYLTQGAPAAPLRDAAHADVARAVALASGG
jgi:beta-lactamase class A